MKIYTLKADSEEQLAVVTARTSRSPNTFDTILEEVRTKGHVEFIKTNVLGYGHDSVAEIAMCPAVAIEDISDLAANVIATADPQLRVQMTSTRYQDMSKRNVFTQVDAQHVEKCMAGMAMRNDYMVGMEVIQKILDATNHPRKRTLQCDIARAFLPAGVSTQVAIRGDARTMRDTTAFLLGHKLAEVRAAGELIRIALKQDIEVLFDRHIAPAVTSTDLQSGSHDFLPGEAEFMTSLDGADELTLDELAAWRDSGWRRRMRMQACPEGPYLTAAIFSDYGAYRDLRRNRTIIQTDLLPEPNKVPRDALWAFRELYPDVCEAIEKQTQWDYKHTTHDHKDPYLAPMGSMMQWDGGGHIFNWAYLLRLRSGTMCHPGYAIPARHLMREILDENLLADAIGLVESKNSLLGVEFSDRVLA